MGQFTQNGVIYEELPDGNVRVVGYEQAPTRGGIYTLPQSPDKARQQSLEEQRVANAAAANAEANAIRRAQLDANLYAKGLRMGANGQIEPIPGWSPPMTAASSPKITANVRRDAIDQFKNAASLERIAADLMEKYKVGPGATTGIAAIQDYLPLAKNQVLDQTANQARGYVKSALGFTGGEGNTIGEIALNYGPYLPEASDKDAVIVQKIEALRNLAADARAKATTVLGGVPDANGQIIPQNAMDQVNVVGAQTQAMGAGSNANAVANLPPEAQAEYQAYLTQNAGRLDPNAYAQFRLGLAAKYGIQDDPARAAIYAQEAATLNDYFAKGGRTFSTPVVDQPMTGGDRLRNAAVNNPFGAAIVGAADAGGFGAVSALAGDQMDALREANPISSVVGGAVGAVGATSALGKIGRRISQGLAPKLLQGGGRAQFGRNLATDATYGGIYGTATEGDPLTGAVVGGVASGLGQGIGSGLGRAVGGVDMAPAAAYLRGRGVDGMTTGQMMGGFAKRLEDKAMSIPGVGDMIGNRRLEGFQSFNRAAMNEAGAPIGATTSNYGEAGIADLLDQTGRAYDSATAGVTVPLDSQFTQGMAAARQAAGALPPDLAPRAMTAINNRVGPIAVAGDMTGDAYQQAIRGLKGYKAEATKPGFEADYRDTLTQAMDVLTSQMRRGGGSSVVEGLDRANAAYRGIKTLENAVSAAKNGTGSGQVQLFTPAQLNAAGYRAAAKYPGARPFADLADAGQEVLPSQVPDSGTAGRLLAAGLPVGLGGAAAGSEQFGLDNISKALGMAALLSAGASKTGQKAINKLLFDRPDAAKAAGSLIRKRKGLFGSASVPLMLEATQ